MLKCDDCMLSVRNIYACYACHTITLVEIGTLTLALLVPRILTNYANYTFTFDDAAVTTDSLY
jgi:hypothetical protein